MSYRSFAVDVRPRNADARPDLRAHGVLTARNMRQCERLVRDAIPARDRDAVLITICNLGG